jgi:hypothetical protein
MPSRRRLLLGLLALFVIVSASLSGVGCALSAPRWSGTPTEHFDGQQFFTPGAPPMVGGSDRSPGLRRRCRAPIAARAATVSAETSRLSSGS